MTPGFARDARRTGITTAELCRAAQDIIAGLAIDLGGGVYKKRLNQNRHRGIVLARGTQHMCFVYLYAKQDQANIDPSDLHQLRRLAKEYETLTVGHLAILLNAADLKEVPCEAS